MMMLSRAAAVAVFFWSNAFASGVPPTQAAHPMSSHPHPADPHAQPHAAARAPTTTTSSSLPPYPSARFVAWEKLDDATRDHAHKLGYHEKYWNKPGQLPLEKMDYESLPEKQRSEVTALGLSQDQWDCYVNHYRNYDWEELGNHQQPYATLGWKGADWNAGQVDATDIEGKYWGELSSAQRAAATSLCYTQALWDEIAIPLWDQDDGSGGDFVQDAKDLYSAKETHVAQEKQDEYESLYDANDRTREGFQGPASAHNNRNIAVPFFRYEPWELIHKDLKKLAQQAGYDEKTWNDIGSHPMEKTDFESIGIKHKNVQHALLQMGFTEAIWDCYMSHYQSYEWDELKQYKVQQYYQELGYTHKAWDSGDRPEAIELYWPDLTVTQQNAAYELGYFREVWDEVSLQFWPRTTSNTKSLKKYAKAHPAAVGGGLFGTLTLLVGCIFCCACCVRQSKKKSTIAGMPSDLEMYPPGFGERGYTDDPEEGETYEDEYEDK